MDKPSVSVIIPSYNHAPYIGQAIQSVLDQTFADFELLISDDCSTDDTFVIASSFSDPRIRLFCQARNVGIAGNMQFLLDRVRGRYFALLNSDDWWEKEKLQKQFAYMEAHPETAVCFTHAELVDEQGRPYTKAALKIGACPLEFSSVNLTRAEYLRSFWDWGNFLCDPSKLARTEIYTKELPMNPGLRQLLDFELWIRTCQRYEMHIIEEPLMHFRWFSDHRNGSAASPENGRRGINEMRWIAALLVQETPDDLFAEAFSDLFRNTGASSHTELMCERFFLLLDCERHQRNVASIEYPSLAIQFFIAACREPDFPVCMETCYGYTLKDFYAFTGSYKGSVVAGLESSLSWRITAPLRWIWARVCEKHADGAAQLPNENAKGETEKCLDRNRPRASNTLRR